jgi:hypothetical protein
MSPRYQPRAALPVSAHLKTLARADLDLCSAASPFNRPGGQDSDAADSQAVMRLFAWFNIARIRDLRRRDGIGRWVALPSGS